ncbi:Coenzyme F420 hydrogenase/dehydrogenase, beta subunit C-terminal domain [Amedibacillus sp. YH-ame10]
MGYLESGKKEECTGCEACASICPKKAILMNEDMEGFRYPIIIQELCIHCSLCNKVCPYGYENELKNYEKPSVYGGYNISESVREESTSGGAFSAIVDTWYDESSVIFGATSDVLDVYHIYTESKYEYQKIRKSKYSQSVIGDTYAQVRKFLNEDRKVLFSGTPCQISGLKKFLKICNTSEDNLLTVEVICEGVPSPYFIRKYANYINMKYKSPITSIDYRHKDGKRWDFEVMSTRLKNGKYLKRDRWFNPFWSIWLQHLMSRPSCYQCPFTSTERIADITLGDLWGVHIYCPGLYGHNGGASLILCNTEKGEKAYQNARKKMNDSELNLNDALRYQSPLRNPISKNEKREVFMKDLADEKLGYKFICKKWADSSSLKLLFSKYVWGNKQKVRLWNFMHRFDR